MFRDFLIRKISIHKSEFIQSHTRETSTVNPASALSQEIPDIFHEPEPNYYPAESGGVEPQMIMRFSVLITSAHSWVGLPHISLLSASCCFSSK